MLGLGMGAFAASPKRPFSANLTIIATLLLISSLPDLDVIAFSLGIPYHHPLGHRGFWHSAVFTGLIAVVFFFGCQMSMKARATKKLGLTELVVFFIVAVSHPLLDMMTNGGLGCAIFSPFSLERHFFPWQPIPVSPIGLNPRVLPIIAWEARIIVPFAVVMWTGRYLMGLKR